MGNFYHDLSDFQKSYFNFMLNEDSERKRALSHPMEALLLSCRRWGKLDTKLLYERLSAYYGSGYSLDELVAMASHELDRERGIK